MKSSQWSTKGNKFLPNARADYARHAADRNLLSPVVRELKRQAHTQFVLPRVLTTIHWVMPAHSKLKQLRTAGIKASWSIHRPLRCIEVVASILQRPTRDDVFGAIIVRNLCDARRILCKRDSRSDLFRDQLFNTAHDALQGKRPGPVNNFNHICDLLRVSQDIE